MEKTNDAKQKLPQTFKDFVAKYPELGQAHEQVDEPQADKLGAAEYQDFHLYASFLQR